MNHRFALPLLATLALCACERPPPDLVKVPPAPAALAIRNVAVLDVATGKRSKPRDVLVIGTRIDTIAARGRISPPAGAQEMDGSGATLLPGLIDMHGHIGQSPAPSWLRRTPDPERNLRSYLYCGVTTVLDPGDLVNKAFERRDLVAAGALPGPRIFASGPIITAEHGHPVPIIENLAPWFIRWYLVPRVARQVASPDAARAAVRELAALGADVVKLAVDSIPQQAPRLARDTLTAAGDEARQAGLRMVAHIGTVQDAIDAADAGAALWVHGVYKERIPDDQIARLAAYRIAMVPTIAAFEGYALLGQGPRVPTALERETVPADVLAAFDHPPARSKAGEFFREHFALLRQMRLQWRDNVRRLRAAGVTILAGSDTQMGVFPGPGLHRELGFLVESGLTPAQAIRAATIDAARWLANGKEPEFGIVAPGKTADLLLVDGDPTKDLAALARIKAVIKNGVPLERRAI